MMRASDVSPRMFDNDFLDYFSRTHWLVVPFLWLPVAAALVGWAFVGGVSGWITIPAVLAGLLVWSLSEYWLHRTFFHWEPQTWWGPKLHFFFHGVHHQWHQDPYRLVMPPGISIPLGGVFFGVFWAIAQLLALAGIPAGWHLGAFAGFVVGYVLYDCTHYYLHHFRPRSARMKALRAHHMNHHHNDPDRKFGVSTRFWDRVFKTA